MSHRIIRTALLLSLAALVPACGQRAEVASTGSTNAPVAGSAEKLKRDAKDAVTTTTSYLTRQRERFQKSFSGKMSALDKQLSELKSKSAKASEQAKSEWAQTLAELQKKRQAAADKLEGLKRSSTDTWRDFKAGVESAFTDLEGSLKDAFSHSNNKRQSGQR